MTALPSKTDRKLGLVIDLDTCVGCHACVIACKGWNTENYGAALGDSDPYGSEPEGSFLNRIHSYEILPEADGASAGGDRTDSGVDSGDGVGGDRPTRAEGGGVAGAEGDAPGSGDASVFVDSEGGVGVGGDRTIRAEGATPTRAEGDRITRAGGDMTARAEGTGAGGDTAASAKGAGGGVGLAQVVHFPKSCLHCDDAPCVTVCPTGASYKRAEDGIVLVDEADCIGCGLCAWACPYGAREMDPVEKVMKKCTLCVDRIYNENLAEEDRVPACVRTCPAGARHFGDLGDPDSEVSRLVAERGGFDLMPEQETRPVNKYLPPRRRDMDRRSESSGTSLPEPVANDLGGFLGWLDKALERLG